VRAYAEGKEESERLTNRWHLLAAACSWLLPFNCTQLLPRPPYAYCLTTKAYMCPNMALCLLSTLNVSYMCPNIRYDEKS